MIRSTWIRARARAILLPLLALAPLTLVPPESLACPQPPPTEGFQGFGAATRGGAGGAVVHVTNLDDSGPGSLRDALSRGNRTVVFDVAGEIVLRSEVSVLGPYVTIDGTTAPPPGITLRNFGLDIRGTRNAHDVIVRGIRVRDAADDGIRVAYGAYNIVIDHVSVQGAVDGNLDITEDAHDVTVSWSILARPKGAGDPGANSRSAQKNMLIAYGASRVTLHHNLFVDAQQRNPLAMMAGRGPARDTTLDMRHNLVWNWEGGVGTDLRDGVRANVVGNLYGGARDMADAIHVYTGTANDPRTYLAENLRADNLPFGPRAVSTETGPFPAPAVPGTTACAEALRVLAEAGVAPRDTIDQWYLAEIQLPLCGGGPVAAAALTPAGAGVWSATFLSPAAGAVVQGITTVKMAFAGAAALPSTFTLTVDDRVVFNRTVQASSTSFAWDSRTVANGPHRLGLTIRDAGGRAISTDREVEVRN